MAQGAREPLSATYQIFINHRGPDVKKILASLIDRDLKLHGLRVFLDKRELRPGDTIEEAIKEAILSASVHIVMFSEKYAESRWCLNELALILESSDKHNSKIIPVFCDVEPASIRNFESGCYATAFQYHQNKGRVVAEWKTAVTRASEISGIVFESKKSDYGEILGEIVNAVLKEVKREQLEGAIYPVGLDQAVLDFQNEILKHSELTAGTMVVGIVGISGIGKSTLAKHFYNSKRTDFSRYSFLSDVREADLLSLQHQLLRDLSSRDTGIDNTSHGKGILREYLRGYRALIVLDDVDHDKQLDSLLVPDVLGSGSLILITCRDKDLLKSYELSYDVKPLQRKHAQELFCWHASGQPEPYEGFENLVDEFLQICGGVPLCLKVLGGQLRPSQRQLVPDREQWGRQLKKLLKSLPAKIIDTLKESYECLNYKEKDMFLDVGCFFVGETRDLAVRVLEGLGYKDAWDGLESLRQKCLLDYRYEVQRDDRFGRTEELCGDGYYENLCLPLPKETYIITMHNHVREFARNVAREHFSVARAVPVRLCSSNDIEEMLQLQDGADPCLIRGIRIRTPKGQNLLDGTNYIKGVGLRLFVVEDPVDLSSLFSLWTIEGSLVWLRLPNLGSFKFPDTISLTRLRVLELKGHGDLEQFFSKFDKPPWFLTELDINVRDTDPSTSSGPGSSDIEPSKGKSTSSIAQQGQAASSLFRFLGYIGSGANFLAKIVLKNVTSLQSLPIDFSKIKSLRHLDLSGCTNLTQLPKSFSELIHLQYLALRDCISLSIPKQSLGEISTLEYVDFKGCSKLVELPEGIAYQSRLRYLNLLYTCLREMPSSLGLDELEYLRIGSTKLRELPQSVGHLLGLQELILVECRGLNRMLPEEIAGPNIKVLVVVGCPIDNFSFEDQGTNIHVGMNVLRDFTLKNTGISKICVPESVFPKLETVDLSDNIQLTEVTGLPSTLVRLSLQNCRGLKILTNLSNLGKLKFLGINGCIALETLNVEGLTSLQEIKAEGCWELKRIERSDQLEQLNCLHISADNRDIWSDIGQYLTSPSHVKLSTASFSGMANDKTILDEAKAEIMGKFKVEMVDILPATTDASGFHVKSDDFHSRGAILMCFITSDASPPVFRVRFEASNYGGLTQQYSSLRGSGRGRSLHVFIWTENSDLFKDYRDCSDIAVYTSDIGVSELDAVPVERGWVMMLDKHTDVWEVCKEFMVGFA